VETGSQDAVSIRAIAEACGITPPAIYLHFADKDELFFEMCEENFQAFAETLKAAASSTEDPVESLRRSGETYIRFAIANPEHYRVIFMSDIPSPPDKQLEESAGYKCFMALVEGVSRAVESGAFRSVDPFATAIALWAGVHGLASLIITDKEFPWPDTDTMIDNVLDMELRGLLA
jgi:AcrR family transcriptional regulator